MEEGGKRVRWRFWHEAHAADVATALTRIEIPTYVVLAAADAHIASADQQKLLQASAPHGQIEQLSGYPHSGWTSEQAEPVVEATTAFLVRTTS
jgi:pimeloyl-ACP methyl ester carboxylesterase